MGILPSCNFNTSIWLHHLDFNEIPGEKARWELYKDDACYFEEFLKAEPYKTASV